MPSAVSDFTLPTATPVVAATATTTKAPPIMTTRKLMSNGEVLQTQSEQNQQQQLSREEHNDTFKRTFRNNNKEKPQQFIVKYRQKYYDIARFLKNHPGGVNTLRSLKDGDITTRFLHAPPHSDAAIYLMKEYEIKPEHIQLQSNVKRRQHLQQMPNGDDEPLLVTLVDREQEHAIEAKTNLNGIQLIADAGQEDKNNNQLDESMES